MSNDDDDVGEVDDGMQSQMACVRLDLKIPESVWVGCIDQIDVGEFYKNFDIPKSDRYVWANTSIINFGTCEAYDEYRGEALSGIKFKIFNTLLIPYIFSNNDTEMGKIIRPKGNAGSYGIVDSDYLWFYLNDSDGSPTNLGVHWGNLVIVGLPALIEYCKRNDQINMDDIKDFCAIFVFDSMTSYGLLSNDRETSLRGYEIIHAVIFATN